MERIQERQPGNAYSESVTLKPADVSPIASDDDNRSTSDDCDTREESPPVEPAS